MKNGCSERIGSLSSLLHDFLYKFSRDSSECDSRCGDMPRRRHNQQCNHSGACASTTATAPVNFLILFLERSTCCTDRKMNFSSLEFHSLKFDDELHS